MHAVIHFRSDHLIDFHLGPEKVPQLSDCFGPRLEGIDHLGDSLLVFDLAVLRHGSIKVRVEVVPCKVVVIEEGLWIEVVQLDQFYLLRLLENTCSPVFHPIEHR